MASIINALTSGTGGIVTAGDASGILQLQTANTAAVTIDGSQNVGIGTASPVAKQHIKGSGTSGQTTASLIVENGSSGTFGLDITGTAGSSYARLRYGGGPGTGTNSMTGDVALIGLEGSSIGFQQIKFAPTQVASSDANTLDDYEEGTWTPSLAGQSGSLTAYTSGGYYVKIGSIVTIYGWVRITTAGTAAGYANVYGLPFSIANQTGYYRNQGTAQESQNTGLFYQLFSISSTNLYFGTTTNGPITWTAGYTYPFQLTYQST